MIWEEISLVAFGSCTYIISSFKQIVGLLLGVPPDEPHGAIEECVEVIR